MKKTILVYIAIATTRSAVPLSDGTKWISSRTVAVIASNMQTSEGRRHKQEDSDGFEDIDREQEESADVFKAGERVQGLQSS